MSRVAGTFAVGPRGLQGERGLAATNIVHYWKSATVDPNLGDDAAALAAITTDANEDRSYPEPFKTLNSAYDATRNGDSITVLPGLYVESLTLTLDRATSINFYAGTKWQPEDGQALINNTSAAPRLDIVGGVSIDLTDQTFCSSQAESTVTISCKEITGLAGSQVYIPTKKGCTLEIKAEKDVTAEQWCLIRSGGGSFNVEADNIISLGFFSYKNALDIHDNEWGEIWVQAVHSIDSGNHGRGALLSYCGNMSSKLVAGQTIYHGRTWQSGERSGLLSAEPILSDLDLDECEVLLASPTVVVENAGVLEVLSQGFLSSDVNIVVSVNHISQRNSGDNNRFTFAFDMADSAYKQNAIFTKPCTISTESSSAIFNGTLDGTVQAAARIIANKADSFPFIVPAGETVQEESALIDYV